MHLLQYENLMLLKIWDKIMKLNVCSPTIILMLVGFLLPLPDKLNPCHKSTVQILMKHEF